MSPASQEPSSGSRDQMPNGNIPHIQRANYEPPWANTSIIGVAGSSGSGKTSLALAIIKELNLPWVVIMSMDSFYKPLTPEESAKAFRNEYDFDAPEAIDFDILVERLGEIKAGYCYSYFLVLGCNRLTLRSKKADIPVYSFEKHARQERTTTIYSPHVLILEGIFALHDQRVLDMLDLKIFAEAESDLCLSRRRELRPPCLDVLYILMYFGLQSFEMSANAVETSKVASSNGSLS